MLILLCLILTFMLNCKKWPCLFSSCWAVIVLGVLAEIVWIRELLQSEFWKNFSNTANVSELCLFIFLLFVCSLIFGIKRWTQLFFNFFLLFCFFLQFLFDAIWELFRYGNYLGRYGNCSDMGIIQAVTGNIQADKFQNDVFFFYFLFVP